MNKSKNSNEDYPIVSLRLPKDIVRKLDFKASEEGCSRTFYIKKLLVKHATEEETSENIVYSALNTLTETINRQNTETEYFRQLYLMFLTQWFYAHPMPARDSNSIEKINAVKNKDLFIKNFNDTMYEEAGNLYDKLFANNIENQKEDE